MADSKRTATVVLQYQTNKTSAAQVVADNNSTLDAIRKRADAAYDAHVAQLTADQSKTKSTLAANRAAYDAAYEAQVKQANALATIKSRTSASSDVTDYKALADAYQTAQEASDAFAASQANQAAPAIQEADAATKTLIHDLDELATKKREIASLPDPELSAFGIGTSASGSKGTSAGQFASRVAGIGSILGGAGGEGARDISQIIQLGTTFGIVGAASGFAAILINKAAEAEANRAKAAQDAANTLNQLAGDVAGGATTQAINKQISQQQTQRQVLGQVQDQLQFYNSELESTKNLLSRGVISQEEYNRVTALIGRSVDEVSGGAVTAAGGMLDLKKLLDDNQKSIEGVTVKIGGLNLELTTSAVALNDAIEAEKLRQQAIVESNKQLIGLYDQEANTRTQLAALRRTGTTEQVQAELDANKERETIIQQYLLPNVTKMGLTSAEASAKIIDLNSELGNLREMDQLLVQAVLPVVAARDAEIALVKAQKDQSDALNDVLQDINKTTVDLAEASKKTAAALADQQQAERDHSNKLIDIQAQYAAAQMTALQKKNEQFAKIDQQAASRALEQRENLNLQIEGLVATGHIAEAQQAIRAQRLKETQDARQVQQQKDDATKNYNDQLKAADDQKAKLLDSEADRYAKERQQRQEAYNKAVEDQRALQNRLQSLRDQEQSVTRYWISATVTALYKVQDATGAFAANMQNYANQINATNSARMSGVSGGSTGVAAALHSSLGGSQSSVEANLAAFYASYGRGSGGGGRATLTSFDVGTNFVPRDMIAMVHRGERIIPAGQNGAPSVVFNIDAKGSNMSEAEWQRRLEPVKVEVVQKLTEIHNRQKR